MKLSTFSFFILLWSIAAIHYAFAVGSSIENNKISDREEKTLETRALQGDGFSSVQACQLRQLRHVCQTKERIGTVLGDNFCGRRITGRKLPVGHDLV